MDRRAFLTREGIKDAFLALVSEMGYRKINVTALCKKANIARATFYLHYDFLDEVLEEILGDAIKIAESPAIDGKSLGELLRILETKGSIDNAFMPVCQRVVEIPRYKPLFLDEDLSEKILQFIYKEKKNEMVPKIAKEYGLSLPLAEKLFIFILHGTFFVNKSMDWEKSKEWYDVQKMILKLLSGGVQKL